jgi:hypothetical protein
MKGRFLKRLLDETLGERDRNGSIRGLGNWHSAFAIATYQKQAHKM